MRVENFAPSSPSNPHETPLTSENISHTVTRYDLATAIMKRLPHVSRRKALDLVDCALEEIAEALLERRECVKLHEFGTFCVRERTEGAGHAPLAVEGATRPRRRFVGFKASLRLKQKVEKARSRSTARHTLGS
jgi:nucleoid DNA-binding protein